MPTDTVQKLLRRAAQAERQVARRKAKRNDAMKRATVNLDFRKRMGAVRDANKALSAARLRRREDWELGPLAPQRDTPIRNSDGSYWGSLSLTRTMGDLPHKQLSLACKWAGGQRYLCLKAGDRVAIMQGPDKGKIGTVRSIAQSDGCVVLDGDNLQQNVTVSDYITKAKISPEETFVQLTPLRVPIWAVRLVHPLRDPATGKIRDVIIDKLVPTRFIRDAPTGRQTWSRVVPGLNIEIPWPKVHEDAERAELETPKVDHECDTLRIDVEESTFVPSILRPPMPAAVLDELRNRYSKFRTRHHPDYIAKKEAEAQEKLAHQRAAKTMRTPQQELMDLIHEQARRRPAPSLTEDMLIKIGEVMARNRNRAPEVKNISQGLVTTANKRAQERKIRERLMAKSKAEIYKAVELEAEAAAKTAPEEEAEVQALKAKVAEHKANAEKLRTRATLPVRTRSAAPSALPTPPPSTAGIDLSASQPSPQEATTPPS